MTNIETELKYAEAIIREEFEDLLEGAANLAPLATQIAFDIGQAALIPDGALVDELKDQLRLMQQQGALQVRQGRQDAWDAFLDRGISILTRALLALVV